MINKLSSLSDAVKKYVHDRSIIAMGGFPLSRETPIFFKEILRQHRAGSLNVNDLTLVGPSITLGGSMLVAEGLVDSVISPFAGHERPGLSVIAKEALEKGLPRKIKWEDESNLSLAMRLMAGALNLPFITCTSGIWGDLKKQGLVEGMGPYPKNIVMEDPFGSARKVALLQAIMPDISVLHVPFADIHGNGIVLGSGYHDIWISRAGKNTILIADHIIDTEACRRYPNLVMFPGAGVSAVVPWRFGAWPTNCVGLYKEDVDHMQYFLKNSRRETLQEYMEKYVYSWTSHDEYVDVIGQNRIDFLEDDPSTVLSEPLKPWILPADEVAALLPG